MFIIVLALVIARVDHTRAETRATFRLGVLPLDLRSSSDTPLFGSQVDRVVDRYNDAADAYDRMNGGTTARIDQSDLGLDETLLVFAPGLEAGDGMYFFRIEAPLGVSDVLRSFGVGLYPLNLQLALHRSLAIYGSLGGSASWLDRPGPGDKGGLLTARVAIGARVARHVMIELGYNAFALGGTVNEERLANMGEVVAMPPAPSDVVAAGEANGIFDASVGVAF
jgi:hypothetical protein